MVKAGILGKVYLSFSDDERGSLIVVVNVTDCKAGAQRNNVFAFLQVHHTLRVSVIGTFVTER